MANEIPKLIPINHDDYHAKYVGRTADGLQFFLTNPFVPAPENRGREFLALYLFDAEGNLQEARIDDLGTRADWNVEQYDALVQSRLAGLGEISFERIEIAPFQIERFGVTFGLIPEEPEDEDDEICWVNVEPGNYMAFTEPWDGDYDT